MEGFLPDRVSAATLLARFVTARVRDVVTTMGLDLCCRNTEDDKGSAALRRQLPGQAAWNHATSEQITSSLKNHPHDNEQIEIACRALYWKAKSGPQPKEAALEIMQADGCHRLLSVLQAEALKPSALIACFNAIEAMCAAAEECVAAFASNGAAHATLSVMKARTDQKELVENGMRVLAAIAPFAGGTMFAGSVRALVDVMCGSMDNVRAMAVAFRILYTLIGLAPAPTLGVFMEEGVDAVACGVVCANYKYQSGMLARLVSGAVAEASAEAITLLGHMYDKADEPRRKALRSSMAQHGFLAALANVAASSTTETTVAIQALALLCLACEGSPENVQIASDQGAAEPLAQLLASTWDARVKQLAKTSLGYVRPDAPQLAAADARPPPPPPVPPLRAASSMDASPRYPPRPPSLGASPRLPHLPSPGPSGYGSPRSSSARDSPLYLSVADQSPRPLADPAALRLAAAAAAAAAPAPAPQSPEGGAPLLAPRRAAEAGSPPATPLTPSVFREPRAAPRGASISGRASFHTTLPRVDERAGPAARPTARFLL